MNGNGPYDSQARTIIHTVSGRVPPMPDELECLNSNYDNCGGEVSYRAVPGGTVWPRCEVHFEQRMDRYENSMERYANSDVLPAWFDPSYAGESWDDE